MKPAATIMFVLLTTSSIAACKQQPTEPPQGEILLESLRFTQADAEAGETLVLIAGTKETSIVSPQPVQVLASSGAEITVQMRVSEGCPQRLTEPQRRSGITPWESCSDAELTAAVAQAARGIVGIGFKEADAKRGVDQETGRVLVSDETVQRMKEWVVQQGITIEREPSLVPAVWTGMPAKLALVSMVREHPNVDYLEPNTTGEYLDAVERTKLDLVSVVPTASREGAGLRVHPGETVTAKYRQPDGSVLTARISIRK